MLLETRQKHFFCSVSLNPYHLEIYISSEVWSRWRKSSWGMQTRWWSADVGKYLGAACSVWAFLLKICHFWKNRDPVLEQAGYYDIPMDIGNTNGWLYHTPWRPLSGFYLSRTELQTFPWDMTMQTTKKRTKIIKTNKTDNTADGDEWNETSNFNGFPLGIMNAVICYAIFHLWNSFDKLACTLWQIEVLWSIKKRRLTCIISPVLFKCVSHWGFTCPSFHWWPLVAKYRAAEGFKGTVQPKIKNSVIIYQSCGSMHFCMQEILRAQQLWSSMKWLSLHGFQNISLRFWSTYT